MNDARRPEAREGLSGNSPWYRSPLVMLAGLVVVAGAIALLVAGLGGGDDDVAADEPAAVNAGSDASASAGADSAAGDAAVGQTVSFGGAGIPEIADVVIEGAALERIDPSAANDPAVGTPAPVVTATSLADGSPVTLGPGNAYIVAFLAHWCPHCQAEIPELVEWANAGGIPDGVEFVAVSTAVNADGGNFPPSAWFTAEGWPGTVIVDDASASLLNTYGFGGFPALIAIDADGNVAGRLTGNVGTDGFDALADTLE